MRSGLVPILFAAFWLPGVAFATVFDTTVTLLDAGDFTSGLPAGATASYAIDSPFTLTQDFGTGFFDGSPLGGTLDGLSDGSASTGLGIGDNVFPDNDHYVLSVSAPGSAAVADFFGGAATAGAYDWTLSFYGLSPTGLFDSIKSTIMKGSITTVDPSTSILTVAEGIEWFVNGVDPATGAVGGTQRAGARLVGFDSFRLQTLSGGGMRLSAVPEPATLILGLLGFAAMGFARRRSAA